jgi:hypothetical protein
MHKRSFMKLHEFYLPSSRVIKLGGGGVEEGREKRNTYRVLEVETCSKESLRSTMGGHRLDPIEDKDR